MKTQHQGRDATRRSGRGGRGKQLLVALSLALAGAVLLVQRASADPPISDLFAQANLAAKHAMEQQVIDALASARGLPASSKVPDRGRGVPIGSPEPWPSGIIAQPSTPFSPELYRITNAWQGVIGNANVQVYAGALASNPAQGIVVVRTTSFEPDGSHSGGDLRTAPSRSGALSVTSVVGTHLVLTAADGSRIGFDVSTRSFSTP